MKGNRGSKTPLCQEGEEEEASQPWVYRIMCPA